MDATFSVDYPGDYGRMLPVTRGSHPTPNFEGTYENLDPNAALYLKKKGRDLLEAGFSSQLGSINNEKGAIIATVINAANGVENKYTIGKGQILEGRDLGGLADTEHTGTGVFYISSTGAIVTVGGTDYLTREPSRATWIVPAGLTGPQTLKIVVWMNGGLRTTIYSEPLTP